MKISLVIRTGLRNGWKKEDTTSSSDARTTHVFSYVVQFVMKDGKGSVYVSRKGKVW